MLRFYTIKNTWLRRAGKEIGSLEVGKRADFVVLNRDLLTCPDENIREAQVRPPGSTVLSCHGGKEKDIRD